MKLITEKNSKILIFVGVLLLAFGLIMFLITAQINKSWIVDTTKFSEFGDFFGGVVGAIWSLAGVILFYIALQEQRKDIKINQEALIKQIEEFELQRVELGETRAVFKDQSETLKIQRFENTFFQLMNLYNEIIGNLKFESYEKREVFTMSGEILRVNFRNYLDNYVGDGYGGFKLESVFELNHINDVEPHINSVYKNFYFERTSQKLSNYFRTVYHIFKFIHQSKLLDEKEKQFYASIFRAQLSSDELYLIFYNSIHKNLGYPNMLFLIKRFDVLQNFDFGLVSIFKYHYELFNQKSKELQDVEF